MGRRRLVIAIDGPSGAGKGTVARTVASQLGFRHVDTGAMSRAVAWKATATAVDIWDGEAIAALAAAATFEVDGRVRIDGHDVTAEIRTPAIDRAAAVVAQHPAVRAVLVRRQRTYGEAGGLVMEGRDLGSVVFPEADVKVYLDASADERARRRAQDAAHSASRVIGVEHIAEELERRDRTDRTRAVSPLTLAADAVYLDTTSLPLAEVVERVLELVRTKLPATRSGQAG
jgi:cytidylate kinase